MVNFSTMPELIRRQIILIRRVNLSSGTDSNPLKYRQKIVTLPPRTMLWGGVVCIILWVSESYDICHGVLNTHK